MATRPTIGMYGEMFLADHLIGGDPEYTDTTSGGGVTQALSAESDGTATVSGTQVNRVRRMSVSPAGLAVVTARLIEQVTLHASTDYQLDNYESQVLTLSPWLYWELNENSSGFVTASDSSGNGRDGSVFGNTSAGQPGAHGVSTSCYFDGSGDSVQYGTVPPFTNTFSYAIWVKPTATVPAYSRSSSGTAGISGSKWAIYPDQQGTNAGSGLSAGTNQIAVWEHGNSYLPPVVVANGSFSGWTHVVVVYNGSPTVSNNTKLYINGILAAQGNGSRSTVYAPHIIGTGPYGDYQGYLDDFVIFSTALSSTDVSSLYAASAPLRTGATVAGSITYAIKGLNASVTCSATVTGDVTKLKRVGTGTATGSATVTGGMGLDAQRLRAAPTGATTVTSRLAKTDVLASTSDGSASVSGNAKRLSVLFASPAGFATVTVDMSRHILRGSSTGSATCSGTRTAIAKAISAFPAGTAALTAKLNEALLLYANCSATANVTGNAVKPKFLTVDSSGSATVAGDVTRHILSALCAGSAACYGATATGTVYMRGTPTGVGTVAARHSIQVTLHTGGATGTSTVTGAAKRVYLLYASTIDGTGTCTTTMQRLRLLRGRVERRFYKTVYDTYTRSDTSTFSSTAVGSPETGLAYYYGFNSEHLYSTEIGGYYDRYFLDSTKRNHGTGRPYVNGNRLMLPAANDPLLGMGAFADGTHTYASTGRLVDAPAHTNYELTYDALHQLGADYFVILNYFESRDITNPTSVGKNFYAVQLSISSSGAATASLKGSHPLISSASFTDAVTTIFSANLSAAVALTYPGLMLTLAVSLDQAGYIKLRVNGVLTNVWRVPYRAMRTLIRQDDPAYTGSLDKASYYLTTSPYAGFSVRGPVSGYITDATTGASYATLSADTSIDNLQVSQLRDDDPNITGAVVTGTLNLDAYRLQGIVSGHGRPVVSDNPSAPGQRSYQYRNVITMDKPVAYWRMDDADPSLAITDIMPTPADGTAQLTSGTPDAVQVGALIDNDGNAAMDPGHSLLEFGQPSKLLGTAPWGWSYSGWIKPNYQVGGFALYRGGPRVFFYDPYAGQSYLDGDNDYGYFVVGTDMPFAKISGETISTEWIRTYHRNSRIPFSVDRVHIGVSYDGTTRRIYLNGELTDVYTDSRALYYGFEIGMVSGDPHEYVGMNVPLGRGDDGAGSSSLAYDVEPAVGEGVADVIDEVAIFHYALSQAQFKEHYLAGLGLENQMVASVAGSSTVTEHFSLQATLSATSNGISDVQYVPLRPLTGTVNGQATVTGSMYLNKLQLKASSTGAVASVNGGLRPNRPIVGSDPIIGTSTVRVFFRVGPGDFDAPIIYTTAIVSGQPGFTRKLAAQTSAGVATVKHTPTADFIQGVAQVFAYLRSGTGGTASGSSRVRAAMRLSEKLRALSAGSASVVLPGFSPPYSGTAAGVAKVTTEPYNNQYGQSLHVRRAFRGAPAGQATLRTNSVDRLGRPVTTPVGTVLMNVRIKGDLGDADIMYGETTVSATMTVVYRRHLDVLGNVSLRRPYELTVEGGVAKSVYPVQPTTPRADSDEGGPPIKVRKTRHLFV